MGETQPTLTKVQRVARLPRVALYSARQSWSQSVVLREVDRHRELFFALLRFTLGRMLQ